ncbi:RHS repeat-associated core domain-containing protein, partial [Flavobacterium sp. T12S277]|uniref:RHS repeat-associated core domain-containing protein n=1 Tax=Flavobacterium sp. T12S277 TaxID=3402752 RepID=UPI003AE0365C
TAIKTDYLGGYQYDSSILKFFPTAEGYVEPSGSSYKYIYQYKDHLGNVRLSYDKTLAIKEENNYYPFGLKHEGYNTVKTGVENKYKYNGKELQDELQLNVYDYGARNYDAAIGRWMNIDPLAEKSRRFNPYTYALNNPVFFIDPDGMEAKPSPLEAAIMSKHVYGDKVKLIGGWKVSSAGKGLKLNNNDTGFKSQVYERTVKGKTEYTYATAGTEDMTDTKQDVKQVFGKSEQYQQSTDNAKELDANLKGAELTFTGHSLGGGLAEANAIATGDNAITFNAAGLSTFSPGGLQKSTTTDAYIVTTDPLNAVQGATGLPTAGGRKHYIEPGSSQGAANGHSIDSAIESLRTQSFGGFVKNSVSNWWKKYK